MCEPLKYAKMYLDHCVQSDHMCSPNIYLTCKITIIKTSKYYSIKTNFDPKNKRKN